MRPKKVPKQMNNNKVFVIIICIKYPHDEVWTTTWSNKSRKEKNQNVDRSFWKKLSNFNWPTCFSIGINGSDEAIFFHSFKRSGAEDRVQWAMRRSDQVSREVDLAVRTRRGYLGFWPGLDVTYDQWPTRNFVNRKRVVVKEYDQAPTHVLV